jgi:hypothetical protein
MKPEMWLFNSLMDAGMSYEAAWTITMLTVMAFLWFGYRFFFGPTGTADKK